MIKTLNDYIEQVRAEERADAAADADRRMMSVIEDLSVARVSVSVAGLLATANLLQDAIGKLIELRIKMRESTS